jgi:PAS domain S-box-containing protein
VRLLCAGLGREDVAAVAKALARAERPACLADCDSVAALDREIDRRPSVILTAADSASLPPLTVMERLEARGRDMPVVALLDPEREAEGGTLLARGLRDYVCRGRLDRLATALQRERETATLRRALKRRGRRLVEREHRFAGLFESLHEIYYRSAIDGTVLDVSPSVTARAGYRPEDLIGRNVRELYVHPEERDAVIARIMASGVVDEFPLELRTKSGEARDALLSARVVRDREGRPFAVEGALRDVTERKRMDTALRRSEERYRLLVESAADPIFMIDREGFLVFVNETAARYLGREPKDLEGTRMRDWFPRPIADWQLQQVRVVISDGVGRTVDSRSEIAGEERWFSAAIRPIREPSGVIQCALIIARDVTSMKRAQDLLRRTEGRYRTLAENFPNGSVFLFDENLRFALAEGAGLVEFGPPKEQLVGRTPCEAFPPEVCAALEPAYRGALEGASTVLEVSYGDRVYEVRVLPVRGEGDDVVQGMAMTQDITARKRAEQEREKLIEELREALASIKTLRGLVPICASCKKVRNDRSYWQQVEEYVHEHSEATFSHGLCRDCARKLYPDFADE